MFRAVIATVTLILSVALGGQMIENLTNSVAEEIAGTTSVEVSASLGGTLESAFDEAYNITD